MQVTILGRGDELGDTSVEGRQFSFLVLREREKIGIGDLAMTDQRKAREGRCCRGEEIVGPELMTGQRNDLVQQSKCLTRSDGLANDLGI